MVHFERSGSSTILHIHGNVDVYGSKDFTRLLAQAAIAPGERVILEFEACRWIDASAMSAIATCRKLLGDELRLVVPPHSELRKIFKHAQHDEYLKLHTDVAAAGVAAAC